MEDGSVLTNVQTIDAYYGPTQTFTHFVFNENTPAGLGITHRNCSATQDEAIGTSIKGAGFYGHKNTSGTFGVVTYTGCSASGLNLGVDGLDRTTLNVDTFTMIGRADTASHMVRLTDPVIANVTNCDWTSNGGRMVQSDNGAVGNDNHNGRNRHSRCWHNIGSCGLRNRRCRCEYNGDYCCIICKLHIILLVSVLATLYLRTNEYTSGLRVVYIGETDNLDSDYNHFGAANMRNSVEGQII